MAMIRLPGDFKEFLKLLTFHRAEYLLVGGIAVGIHGYIRATGDMDIWISRSPENATRVPRAVRESGFDVAEPLEYLFCVPEKVYRMGMPPLRIQVLTGI